MPGISLQAMMFMLVMLMMVKLEEVPFFVDKAVDAMANVTKLRRLSGGVCHICCVFNLQTFCSTRC